MFWNITNNNLHHTEKNLKGYVDMMRAFFHAMDDLEKLVNFYSINGLIETDLKNKWEEFKKSKWDMFNKWVNIML